MPCALLASRLVASAGGSGYWPGRARRPPAAFLRAVVGWRAPTAVLSQGYYHRFSGMVVVFRVTACFRNDPEEGHQESRRKQHFSPVGRVNDLMGFQNQVVLQRRQRSLQEPCFCRENRLPLIYHNPMKQREITREICNRMKRLATRT